MIAAILSLTQRLKGLRIGRDAEVRGALLDLRVAIEEALR